VFRGAVRHCTLYWMTHHNRAEPVLHPLSTGILEIARTYDVTLSCLGDALRPGLGRGRGNDVASSPSSRRWRANERAPGRRTCGDDRGPGTHPMHLNRGERPKREGGSAHGGAILTASGRSSPTSRRATTTITVGHRRGNDRWYGATCCAMVTRKEHLGLPNAEEVREGVIA